MHRACLLLALPAVAAAQQPAPGFRLLQVVQSTDTTLVDAQGAVVHTWSGTFPGLTAHLAPDGSLLRGGRSRPFPGNGVTGAIQRVAFDGTLLWDYRHDGPGSVAHHDLLPMPNGNVLLIAWDVKTAADAIAAGRDPALITGDDFFPDSIVEVQPTGLAAGAVVWEWHVWDHLVQDFDPAKPGYGVVADHPELLDINYPRVALQGGDWNHVNGLDYDPQHDWIVFSARSQDEIYAIDHATTTAEAAGHAGGRQGHGGDLLYRWGNPAAYQRGTAAEQQLFGQHDPRFVPPGLPGAGHLTVFNNGWQPERSAVFELELPLQQDGTFRPLAPNEVHGPALPVWTFDTEGFQSPLMSSAERLPNGDTLVCSAQQLLLFEVTSGGLPFWNYVSPDPQPIFQCDYVDRQLWSTAAELSVAAGGRLDFDHVAGTGPSPRFYLLLGSTSGTEPGVQVPGGVHLPLNDDYLLTSMASTFNQGPFLRTIGTLDASGHGHSTVVVAQGLIPPAFAGTSLAFAHVLFDPSLTAQAASAAVTVRLGP